MERVVLALFWGVVGLVVGLLVKFIGITEIAGFPAPYFLGVAFAISGLLFGKLIFDGFDFYDWFSS